MKYNSRPEVTILLCAAFTRPSCGRVKWTALHGNVCSAPKNFYLQKHSQTIDVFYLKVYVYGAAEWGFQKKQQRNCTRDVVFSIGAACCLRARPARVRARSFCRIDVGRSGFSALRVIKRVGVPVLRAHLDLNGTEGFFFRARKDTRETGVACATPAKATSKANKSVLILSFFFGDASRSLNPYKFGS